MERVLLIVAGIGVGLWAVGLNGCESTSVPSDPWPGLAFAGVALLAAALWRRDRPEK